MLIFSAGELPLGLSQNKFVFGIGMIPRVF
jgi:hypothetical protein